MKRESHSDKGLKTLTLMNTKPEDWGLTPIKWVWEKHPHPVQIECKTCRGRGRTYTYPDGKLFGGEAEVRRALKKPKSKVSYLGYHEIEDYKKKHDIDYRRCPTCPQKVTRGWGPSDYGTGKVIEWKEMDVLVGYPIWPKGVQFDSRFHDAIYYRKGRTNTANAVHSVCELCSKSIHGRWSFLVPVNGRGPDGKMHGMYVGEDCARKFLGLELVLDMDQLKEIKKSERKQRVRIEVTKPGVK